MTPGRVVLDAAPGTESLTSEITPTYFFSRIAAYTLSAVIGRSRTLTPTASSMALAMAGATEVIRFPRCT